ncbi:MAG: hypothetical protein LBK04_03865 [Clostridiales Family XIII bacterium]|nr:hypothetical protein [Clostridiales Family XIII bacterium]
MKKALSIILTLMMCLLALAGCSGGGDSSGGSGDEQPGYVIGVIPFADTAAEQIVWNEYLEEYIGPELNVTFKFVTAPGLDADAAVTAVEELKLAGCEGILGIVDTPAAIEKANDLGMWFIRSGGLSVEADQEEIDDLEYYLGSMGPSSEDEYQAAYDMTKYYIDNGSKDILVYAGMLGLYIPSEMHIQRYQGVIDALEEAGVKYTLPESGSPVTGPGVGEFDSGDSGLNVSVIYGVNIPGLDDTFVDRLTQTCSGKTFDAVIMTVEGSQDMSTWLGGLGITGAKTGEVGSFNPTTTASFNAGTCDYLVGKYASSMGPAVAALINAIDGNADIVKEADGTGSRLIQPFWIAQSPEEYNEMVEFDNVANPAFNKELVDQYIKRLNPDVTAETFAEFAGMSYDDLKALR